MKRLTGVLIAMVIACDAIGAQDGNRRLPEAALVVALAGTRKRNLRA